MNLADLAHNLDLPETDVASKAWDLARARQRERRRRVAIGSAGAATILLAVGLSTLSFRAGPTAPQPADRVDHGSLNSREFAVAVSVARQEADRLADPVTSAYATVAVGTVGDSNTGYECTSGKLLHIKLIGDFNHVVHGSMPGQRYEPTTAVLITADPEGGHACLISVTTGPQTPDADSTLLFTNG